MAAPVTTPTEHWIGGEWRPGAGGSIEVVNPATEEAIAGVPQGTTADVDAAVAAAQQACSAWAGREPAERAAAVRRISEGIAARRDEVAASITAEVGVPISFATKVQASLPVATSAGVADVAESFAWAEEIGNSLVLREPIGVVGAITPWNYPLHQIVAKVAPGTGRRLPRGAQAQ